MAENVKTCIAVTGAGAKCSRNKSKDNNVCSTHLKYVDQRGLRLAEYNWLVATIASDRKKEKREYSGRDYFIHMEDFDEKSQQKIDRLMEVHRAQVLDEDGNRLDDQIVIDMDNHKIREERRAYLLERGLPEDLIESRGLDTN